MIFIPLTIQKYKNIYLNDISIQGRINPVGGPGHSFRETIYNVPRTYGQALPLIPFSIPVIEHHVQIAIRACIDCLLVSGS